MNGLIIKEPWIDLILKGIKAWEIRGSNTTIRGTIALIKSGTGCIFGTAELIDTKRLMAKEFILYEKEHCVKNCELPYLKTYAWILKNPKKFDSPIPYTHPKGAVIWVKLNDIVINGD